MFVTAYHSATEARQEQRPDAIDLARALFEAFAEREGPAEGAWQREVPEDAAVAVFMMIPMDTQGDFTGLECVLRFMSWIVGAQATDFYLPDAYIAMRRGPWTRADGLALIEPRLAAARQRHRPAVAPVTPGRNEPCSRGSGRKYKRCCGGPSR